jgi:hypothetical protein
MIDSFSAPPFPPSVTERGGPRVYASRDSSLRGIALNLPLRLFRSWGRPWGVGVIQFFYLKDAATHGEARVECRFCLLDLCCFNSTHTTIQPRSVRSLGSNCTHVPRPVLCSSFACGTALHHFILLSVI